MSLTLQHLIACGVQPTQARLIIDPLNAAMALFDISSPVRQAAFISQCMHESASFSLMEENLFYRSPERIRSIFPSKVPSLEVAQRLARNPQALANRVYGDRLGNGNETSGDGWKYRGRGILQITGRNNYHDAALELGRPYIEQPDLVAQPSDACLTAAWYWHCNKLNLLADASDVRAITRAVNGPALAGLEHRKQLFDEAVRAIA